MDINSLNIKQLRELIQNAEKRIEELHKTEAASARAKILAYAKELGYDANELLAGMPKSAKKSATVRTPAKPKYRNPDTGETWTGRGLQPKWMVAAMASGKSKESMLIA